MYIGIFDQDILLNPAKFCPSLELMKLSYYHKRRGDIVEFVLSFEDSEKYDILYLSRESLSQKDFPSSFLLQSNLQWVGRGFTGNYVKLPEEVEHSPPDRTFYSTFVKTHENVFTTRTKNQIVRKILSEDFVLLRITNGNELLIDYTKLNYSNQKIILYDYNFYNSSYAKEIFDYFTSRGNELLFLYSSQIKDLDLFVYYSSNSKAITDGRQALLLVHNDGIPITKLMKHIDCFNCYCGYHVPLNEKPTSRKALIAALNIYFYGASRNIKIPIKVDLKPDDWDGAATIYEILMRAFSNILTYKLNPTSNKTVMDEVYHIAGKERCKLINQTIQADRNLYILANLNVRQVRDSGKWRLRL